MSRSLSLLFLAWLQSAPLQDHEALISRIESAVKMPAGAESIDRYDRYYRWSGPGQVVAGFVVPHPPSDPDKGCLIDDGNGTRLCPPPTTKDRKRYQEALARYHGPRDRKWIDGKYLPSDWIDDGGCAVVNVRYDVTRDRVTRIFCNGEG